MKYNALLTFVLISVVFIDASADAPNHRKKRQLLSYLTHLGQNGSNTLGDIVDFSKFFGMSYGNRDPVLRDAYDYIVVGAGPAGCVLANRLTEDPNVKVLLLEIGRAESFLQTIPAAVLFQASTDYNFGYVTERQKKACLAHEDHRCAWHHGRGLGGSTLINFMIYTRGNKRYFDGWNMTGWSYEEVLPYYIKLEDARIRDFDENGYHGKGGYLAVEDSPYRTSLVKAFVKSGEAIGLKYLDYNGAEQFGISYAQYTTKKGQRWSAGRAYLHPIRHRRNLHVLTKAWATQVLIDETTKTAVGVQFTRSKKTFRAMAKREVILSAGAFGSAKLLMLSGIGPKNDLEKLGIKVIQDLPVGASLYEHPGVLGPVFTVSDPIDTHYNYETMLTLENALSYISGSGLFSASFTEGLTYLKTPVAESPDQGWPDVELIMAGYTLAIDSSTASQQFIRLRNETHERYFKPLFNRRAFMYLPMLMHSRTKGSMKLKSTNPYDHPIFNYQYFEDDRDLQALVYAIKGAIAITSQKPFRDLGVELYRTKVPGCESYQIENDDYWRCHVMTLTTPFWHYVGTCKMGLSSDSTAVVDHRLRVFGVNRLRVVDVGIIPRAPSGHTSAFAYMIGEKASDMIKEDNRP